MKQKSGITLISLVVTVIILLILAVLSINMIFGNDGILTKAQTAVDKYQNAQEKEEIEIAKVENEIDVYSTRLEKQWQKIGEVAGTEILSFDATKYTELHFEVFSSVDGDYAESRTVFTQTLTNLYRDYLMAWDNNWLLEVKMNNTSLKINSAKHNGNDSRSTYTIVLYGK